MAQEKVLEAAKGFLKFVNNAPSPFHAVHECKKQLSAAGFKEWRETDHWNVKPLTKGFITRNQSTIIAFAVGGKYQPGNGFSVVKPVSKRTKQGYVQIGVECYGGGTWHTWFDRDLTVAGRVFLKKDDGTLEQKLVRINKPLLRVPNLAIHLNREMGTKFEWNKETHLVPVLATTVAEELMKGAPLDDAHQTTKHSPALVKALADELAVERDQIGDFELCLADYTPGVIGGVADEFIFAPRLDNLHSSYCAMRGLINSMAGLEADTNIRMIALFDNEEVGSQSAQGAESSMLEWTLRRLANGANQSAFEEAIPRSMMLSSDMAHAIHPNYSDKHEDNHRPAMNKGIVIKFNANQRYATTAATTAILREVAKRVDVPLQDFVVRNDSPCGSTIGPIMSAKLGMATIDIGAPQLSMHSIREMCCTVSVLQAETLYQAFFDFYPEIWSKTQL